MPSAPADNWDLTSVRNRFEQCGPRLRRMVAIRMDPRLSARLDPSDIVQETFAEALRRLPEYLEHRAIDFYPWLRQLAEQKLIDLHRTHTAQCRSVGREQRIDGSANSSKQLARILTKSLSTPSRKLAQREQSAQITDALADLSEGDREVLVLFHLEQLTISEICQVLGLTEAAVRSRRRRALERLAGILRSPGESSL